MPRGRKKGDGVLKEIDPQGSALTTAEKLAFGRTADDPIAKMVRTWWSISRTCKQLAEQRDKILQRLAGARPKEKAARRKWEVKANTKLKAIVDAAGAAKMVVDAGTEADKPFMAATGTDAEVVRWYEENRIADDRFAAAHNELYSAARTALWNTNVDWFRMVANAMESEIQAQADTYTLHGALLLLAGMVAQRGWQWVEDKEGNKWLREVPMFDRGASVEKTPRYTIGQVCKKLEEQGKRPVGQADENWQRTVRRACDEIGFPLLRDKPGPKRQRS